MKGVSFLEIRSVIRGATKALAVLTILFSSGISLPARAGTWEYASPYTYGGSAGGTGAVTGRGPGMQLFRENLTYTVTPYTPPQQPPRQRTNWIPFAMIGLAGAAMLMSDSPQNHRPSQPARIAAAGASGRSGYQLVRDNPTGQTSRRSPAAVPLRTRYQQVSPQQIPSGAR